MKTTDRSNIALKKIKTRYEAIKNELGYLELDLFGFHSFAPPSNRLKEAEVILKKVLKIKEII